MIGAAYTILAHSYYEDSRWSTVHLFVRQTGTHLAILNNPKFDHCKARCPLARRPVIHIDVTSLATRPMQNGNANTYHWSLGAALKAKPRVNGITDVERGGEILRN